MRVSLTLAFCGVGAVPWPARGQVVPPTPVIVTAANLPADITASDFFGASAVFANTDFTLPDEVSAVAIDVDVTTSRPADLRVIVIDGDDQTGAETTFVLWDHDTLLDATKQLVTHLQLRAMLPSELVATITDPNRGVISVRVIDEVPASSGLSSAGTFNSCTLIINPDNSGHTAPPSVQLSINGQPAPSVPINFGGPVLIAARATANPSSFQITRLQTKITKLVSAPDPAICAAEGGQPCQGGTVQPNCCGDTSGVGSPSYKSAGVMQTSASGAALTYSAPELPELPPGTYRVEATAWDSAGFQSTIAENLLIGRQFGFFNITYLEVIDNGGTTETIADDTREVTAKLRIENRLPASTGISSNLRVQLVARPVPVFVQQDGPPAIAAIPAMVELGQFPVGTLAPSSFSDITINAIVPAPALINGDTMGIQWEVDAILQQDFGNNQFVPVDSLVVLQGEEPPVHFFSGPGGAKMNPDAGVNNSPFQPRTLSFVEFNPADLLTVVSGSQAQYHLIAVLEPNPLLGGDKTSGASWSAQAPGGLFHAPVVSSSTVVELSATYSIGNVTKTIAQKVTVIPANQPPIVSSLGNISTRLQVGSDANDWGQAGFIIHGTSPKTVLIRGLGPTLTSFNVSGALADPFLTLLDQQTGAVIATNDDWKSTIVGGKITQPLAAQIQYANVAPPNDSESAMIVTLEPEHNYSAVLRGWNSGSGVGLVELYDLSPSSSSRIYDISTRGITTRESPKILDAGVIVSMSAHLVVRALGPTLVQFGVGSALRDPNLFLYNANGAVIAANDNWQIGPYASQIPVSPVNFHPPNALESAIVVTLMRGNYTAVVIGKDGATPEIGLVEVYDLE